MNTKIRTLLLALFLAAYLVALLRVFVFKGLDFDFLFLRIRVSPGSAPRVVDQNYVPLKTIVSYLSGQPRWGIALVNLLGNIIPFMPIGFLLPLLYRPLSWKGAGGIAIGYSLCIETLQRVYRVGAFDVDDLLLNTLGVLFGYWVFARLKNGKAVPRMASLWGTNLVWGTVRLRMMLWNVVVLALILGTLGTVVRYTVQADLFKMVDRTLAERAHAQRDFVPALPRGLDLQYFTGPALRSGSRPDLSGVGAAGLPGGGKPVLPPLEPRILPRDPAKEPAGIPWDEPWDRQAYTRALTGQTVYSTVHDNGMPIRILSLPLERKGQIDGVLQLAYPLDGVLREINSLTATLLALVPFGLLAAGLGGAFLTSRALRPVGEIAATAGRLGASDLSERLPISGSDEFSELSSSFNAMLGRLEEAFERQRRFTADASHELRTPLSIIKTNTSMALEHPWPEERYREFLDAIDTAANRQSRIVEELLFLARADAGRLARDTGPVCLIDVLEESVQVVSRPNQPCIRLEPIAPELLVQGSGSELTRLYINLLENAARHTPPEGRVTVSATVEATAVTVNVADTGEGIAPEHLPHLGERFYRVDAARSAVTGGNGLGLAICRSIIEAHGGQLTIESAPGEGTVVRVRLLLSRAS